VFRPRRSPERFLTTILFTDIVGSTDLAVRLGDRAWQQLVAAHHAAVRQELRRFGGRELDTAGDGFFATFDQPAQAVRAAEAIVTAVARLGVAIRAGFMPLDRFDCGYTEKYMGTPQNIWTTTATDQCSRSLNLGGATCSWSTT
jgi:adenylate/guanylate cyclase family protein